MEALKKAVEQQEQQKMDSFSELWEACLQGDVSKLRAILLSLGEDTAHSVVNVTLDGGNTLLYK